jgi:murein DD-endopeptidase MepM/ murein hydrolase activator NlpD
MRPLAGALLGLFSSALGLMGQAQEQPLNLALPTDNDALFRGGGPDFYQYIERDFKGEKSTPWEGGQYGFVRNPVETSSGVVFTRFHEGIDIRPLRRDASGEPLDEVRAIADGTVVHTNVVAGFSNYGRFVVVEHRWDGSSYYSLYGHLSSIAVKPGTEIRRGEILGVMGHTGEGLNQARAHLHLELNLMLSRQFEAWYDHTFKNDPNHHGIYNGFNLAGIDIARFYLELRKRPALTIPEFLSEEEVFYKVLVPKSKYFDLAKFYPWMIRKIGDTKAEAWEVSFNRAGVPLKIEPTNKAVREPELSYTQSSRTDYSYLTRGVIGGRGEHATLTESGKSLMKLLTYPE